MLSKKLTFSLAYLVMLFAIGLVIVSPAEAGVLDENFGVTFNTTDVSSADGLQLQVPDGSEPLSIMMTFATEVQVAKDLTVAEDGVLDNEDFVVSVYDTLTGQLLGTEEVVPRITDVDLGTTTKKATLQLTGDVAIGRTLFVLLAKGTLENANQADVIKAATSDDTLGKNNLASLTFDIVDVDGGKDGGAPTVLAITQLDSATDDFTPAGVRGPFHVQVMLSEEPKEFTVDHIEVANGKATHLVKGAPVDDIDSLELKGPGGGLLKINTEPTGRDKMYHPYLVTIDPTLEKEDDVVVSVKAFEDMVLPVSNHYRPDPVASLDGNQKLEIAVDPTAVSAAVDVFKPAADHRGANPNLKELPEKAVIKAGGYLVLAKGKTDSDPVSGVENSPAKPADKKTAASKIYNVTYDFGLPFPAGDLSNFFRNGGTLQLLHVDIPGNTAGADGDKGYGGATTGAVAPGDVIISEVMWGLDRNSSNSQYIELHNTTDEDIGIDKGEWVISVGAATDTHYTTVVDVVGNNPASGFWEVPGNDGVSVVEPNDGFFTLVDIVSMSRVEGGTDGTAASSWAASIRPSKNLHGRRIGSPGAANEYEMVEMVEEPPPPPAPATPVAEADDIMITEIMVASNEGRLPQWIELSNVSGAAVSLSGWKLLIDNDAADEDVEAASLELNLGDVEIGEDQVALVVSKEGRNSGIGDGEGDLRADRIVDVQSQVSEDSRYSLISEVGFLLTLMPPQTTAVREYGDVAGNLEGGWDVPASEEGRSSLIRRESGEAGSLAGTDAAGWVLASDTVLDGAYRTTYYGSDEDAGTPGYDSGGALPVELSLFYAKRDAVSGAVVITWETQSELNNAGFFIKRSETRNGKFMVVNPAMIAGAGTTAEKQSYTWTDTSAKPNVVYYYQIEDVSLDGNRQTLTSAQRLRGHIGAAGKATTTWGELKSQE